MEHLFRWVFGAVAAGIGWLSDIHALLICSLVFVAFDFITGIWASRVRAKRDGRLAEWGFESGKAWRTVYKLCFVMSGIILAWLIDIYVLNHLNLKLANLFTGFVCGVEFWSYLENAAEISRHPIFKWLKKYMKDELDKGLGANKNNDDDEQGSEK